jgi:hypothetical protein
MWSRLIDPNGARLLPSAADNNDRMRGLYHDGIRPEVPTLSDFQGQAETPAGHSVDRDDAGTEVDVFFRFTLKASDSGILPPAELVSLRSGLSEWAVNGLSAELL